MHKQHGLSIIEMMIALLISSFLIIGITQVYLDNRENTLFQQSQGQNIDNARFSILLFEQTLAKTGYRRAPDETMEVAFPREVIGACGEMKAGQVVKRLDATSFCIRYQPAFPEARDCAGENIDSIPGPYISADPVTEVFGLADGNLTCGRAGRPSQAIASDIAELSFVYGVNSSEEKQVSKYDPAPGVDDNIRAVRFSVLTASPTEVASTPGSAAYTFWFGDDPEDKRLYTMLSSSTSMRNLMP